MGRDTGPEVRLGRRSVVLVFAVLAAVLLATAVGLVLLWSRG